jgi:hypothetical protein
MSEAGEAKRDGAKLVSNSGRGQNTKKGDAILEDFVIDYKEYAKSYSVSIDNIAKLDTDAYKNGNRQGVFKLVLGGSVRRWVVPEYVFHDYLADRAVVKYFTENYPDILIEAAKALSNE